MKRSKKLLTFSMSLLLLLVMVLPVQASAPLPSIVLKPKEEGVITFEEGKERTLDLSISTNMDLTNVTITPKKSASLRDWPFNLTNSNLTHSIDSLLATTPQDFSYTFTARDGVRDTFYGLVFEITATELPAPVETTVFVQTMPATPVKPEPDPAPPVPTPEPEPTPVIDGGGGSFESGNASMSGGGETPPTGIPRVIVTGFTTEPGVVTAGGNFRLIVHLKNTSTKTKVSNMLINFEAPTEGDAATSAPAFLPSSGSGSIYLDGIAKGGTANVAIELNTKVDLVQKPYTINLSMSYEDASTNAFDTTAAISIPVKQEARFEFSKFEINPSSISVGDDVNVMTNLYNTGRIKLYNVKVKFMGDGIETEDLFIGHVESGATAPIDGMLTTNHATEGPSSFKMIMSYEDEAGDTLTQEETFDLDIMDSMEEGMMMDGEFLDEGMMMDSEMVQGTPSVLPWIAGGVVAAGVVTSIVLVKKSKKKKAAQEEDELTDEVD